MRPQRWRRLRHHSVGLIQISDVCSVPVRLQYAPVQSRQSARLYGWACPPGIASTFVGPANEVRYDRRQIGVLLFLSGFDLEVVRDNATDSRSSRDGSRAPAAHYYRY